MKLFDRVKLTRSLVALGGVVASALGTPPREAHAHPRPLPFTYIYETLGKGEVEIEQYADMTPVRTLSSEGQRVWYAASQFQTEFEYGITDRLELGFYVTYTPSNAAYPLVPSLTNGNGLKQRLRYRLTEPGDLPVDLAIYGELAENEGEIEVEAKLIVQRHLGPLRAVGNAWVEREFYYNGEQEWVLNPTLGAVLDLAPSVQPGLEYWMRAEFGDEERRAFNMGPHHFIGPTLLLEFGKFWWTTGAYFRLNDIHRTANVGDQFGKYWVRTVVGVPL